MPIILNELNLDEALRYMGCPPDAADPATRSLAQCSAAELLPVIRADKDIKRRLKGFAHLRLPDQLNQLIGNCYLPKYLLLTL